MGNKPSRGGSKPSNQKHATDDDKISQEVKCKFKKTDLRLLHSLFEELESDNHLLDKSTFLTLFPTCSGLLAERLYMQFDQDADGAISFPEFLSGISNFVKGDRHERTKLLFLMFDFEREGKLTKANLALMLHSLIDIEQLDEYHENLDEVRETIFSSHQNTELSETPLSFYIDKQALASYMNSAATSPNNSNITHPRENLLNLQHLVDDGTNVDNNNNNHGDGNIQNGESTINNPNHNPSVRRVTSGLDRERFIAGVYQKEMQGNKPTTIFECDDDLSDIDHEYSILSNQRNNETSRKNSKDGEYSIIGHPHEDDNNNNNNHGDEDDDDDFAQHILDRNTQQNKQQQQRNIKTMSNQYNNNKSHQQQQQQQQQQISINNDKPSSPLQTSDKKDDTNDRFQHKSEDITALPPITATHGVRNRQHYSLSNDDVHGNTNKDTESQLLMKSQDELPHTPPHKHQQRVTLNVQDDQVQHIHEDSLFPATTMSGLNNQAQINQLNNNNNNNNNNHTNSNTRLSEADLEQERILLLLEQLHDPAQDHINVIHEITIAAQIGVEQERFFIDAVVEHAFQEHAMASDQGYMSFDGFERWISRHPSVLEALDEILDRLNWNDPRTSMERCPDSSSSARGGGGHGSSKTKGGNNNNDIPQPKLIQQQRLCCLNCGFAIKHCLYCGSELILDPSHMFSTCGNTTSGLCGKFNTLDFTFKHCLQCGVQMQEDISHLVTTGGGVANHNNNNNGPDLIVTTDHANDITMVDHLHLANNNNNNNNYNNRHVNKNGAPTAPSTTLSTQSIGDGSEGNNGVIPYGCLNNHHGISLDTQSNKGTDNVYKNYQHVHNTTQRAAGGGNGNGAGPENKRQSLAGLQPIFSPDNSAMNNNTSITSMSIDPGHQYHQNNNNNHRNNNLQRESHGGAATNNAFLTRNNNNNNNSNQHQVCEQQNQQQSLVLSRAGSAVPSGDVHSQANFTNQTTNHDIVALSPQNSHHHQQHQQQQHYSQQVYSPQQYNTSNNGGQYHHHQPTHPSLASLHRLQTAHNKSLVDPFHHHSSRQVLHYEGLVSIRSHGLIKHFKQRWCLCRGGFLYFFKQRDDSEASFILFLEGSFITPLSGDEYEDDDLYAFEIKTKTHRHVVYVKSIEQRQAWLKVLRAASKTQAIEEYYHFKTQIGKGKFATVYEATNVQSGKNFAVKVVSKVLMAHQQEQDAVRAEIAVLKTLSHPNIIHLKEVYQDEHNIYMVMPLIQHGDLFDRIILRKVFSEETVKLMIWKLLHALDYLHQKGILHCDVKPENILMVDAEDDTKIILADFGLSSFYDPIQGLSKQQGTICYLAPEVLRGEQYTKSIDIYGLGVCCYLLLSGELPFQGYSNEEIIKETLRGKLEFTAPEWDQVISKDARDFVTRMLANDPKNRLSAPDALQHPWFENIRKKEKEQNDRINLTLLRRNFSSNTQHQHQQQHQYGATPNGTVLQYTPIQHGQQNQYYQQMQQQSLSSAGNNNGFGSPQTGNALRQHVSTPGGFQQQQNNTTTAALITPQPLQMHVSLNGTSGSGNHAAVFHTDQQQQHHNINTNHNSRTSTPQPQPVRLAGATTTTMGDSSNNSSHHNGSQQLQQQPLELAATMSLRSNNSNPVGIAQYATVQRGSQQQQQQQQQIPQQTLQQQSSTSAFETTQSNPSTAVAK